MSALLIGWIAIASICLNIFLALVLCGSSAEAQMWKDRFLTALYLGNLTLTEVNLACEQRDRANG